MRFNESLINTYEYDFVTWDKYSWLNPNTFVAILIHLSLYYNNSNSGFHIIYNHMITIYVALKITVLLTILLLYCYYIVFND